MAVYLRGASNILRQSGRCLAPLPQVAFASTSSSVPAIREQTVAHGGPLRPHLGIPVNPNHGLYGFFRMKNERNSHTKPKENGTPEYIALEAPTPNVRPSGRAWEATELRRKSFKDLHTLWYVVLREENLLATQLAEKTRISAHEDPNDHIRRTACRKSKARIKAVISERRYAYKQALRLRRLYRRNPALGKVQENTDDMLEDMEEEWSTAEGKTP